MKKLLVFVVFLMSGLMLSNHIHAAVKENIKGTWEYKVPSAPYEFSIGKIIVGEEAGKTTVKVKFQNGNELKAQNVVCENDSISFAVQIDYNNVKVAAKVMNDKITGKVNSPEGIMDLTATKQKQ